MLATPGVEIAGETAIELGLELPMGESERSLSANLTVQFPLLDGRGMIAGDATYDLITGRVEDSSVKTAWRGSVGEDVTLDMEATVGVLPYVSSNVSVGVGHPLAQGASLLTEIEAEFGGPQKPRVRARTSLTIPFRAALGRRSGLAEVRGTVLDGGGDPMAGIIVAVAGHTAVSARDGTFVFPAIPIGKHMMLVRDLETGLIMLPATPYTIDVSVSGLEVELRVVRAAQLIGKVELAGEGEGAASGAVEGMGAGTRASAGGIVIVLEGPGGTRRVLADEAGMFTASMLAPGTWTASILPSSLPQHHRAVPESLRITIGEGEAQQVAFDVQPVRRSIRFTGGGELGD